MPVVINGTSGIVNNATDLNYTGTLTGGTGVVNLGSGQVYKDASGNVGIGTSSPSSKLEVLGIITASSETTIPVFIATSNQAAGYVPPNIQMRRAGVGGTTTPDNQTLGQIRFDGLSTGSVYDNAAFIQVDSGVNASGGMPCSMTFGTATSGANAVERMRIDSSGNLLVGTTSNPAGNVFVVSGARAAIFTSTQANACSVRANSTSANADEPAIQAVNNSTASSGVGTFYSSLGSGNGAQNNTNCYHLKAITQGIGVNYLYGNGTTSFTSDVRLKKNITTTRDGYAEDLCKLRVVKYNWNTASEGEAQELGLIAQEVEQVFQGLVQDADMEIQGFTPKVLKASVLPFMLLKAIQEQQALITSLTARITALEGTP